MLVLGTERVPPMPALRQKTFKIVPAPLVIEAVPKAPPVLEALNPTVECKCGNCGAILMRGDESKTTLSSSFASPAARTIRPTSDPTQPATDASLGVPSAPCLNDFLPFVGNLRAVIPGLVSMLLHPLARRLRA